MKFRNTFSAFLLLCIFSFGTELPSFAGIKVGVGKVDITPVLGTPLEGYYIERLATNVHDELYVRAMILEDGTNTFVLIVADIIDVAPYGFNAARKRIQEKLQIPASNIVISATHTHTGPIFSQVYEEMLEVKIYDAVKIAMQNMQPAVIKSGAGNEENVSFHRRFMMKDGTVKFNPGALNPDIVRPMGPVDPDVGILYIETADGKPIAVLVNFAIHLDTVGGTEISADFPYFMGQVLKRVLGNDLMVFFGFGTCGNVNHFNVKSPETLKGFERAERIGYALAASVIREFPALEEHNINTFSTENEILQLEIPEYTREQVAAAKINAKKESDHESSTPEIREAMKILKLEERNGKPHEVEVQTIGLGDLAIVALPGEIFVELGLEIKKRSPFKHTLILTLSNYALGYVPNAEAYEYGAYEVEVSEVIKGEGERLVDSSVNQLNKMKN
ncbi:neutral/alkaline non-lysosomal ceramidase N-terminal domain-containing protein [Bacteroidota bacterium]